ncbi:MAG TPA: hypothetical protein VL137_10595 [Polyangiaceae bacterium]|nr:hypothetical protein [Polyangiaceae bacterium]
MIAACTTACNESRTQKPYTPFGVASVAQVPSAAPSAKPTPSEFVPEKALLAPVGAKDWTPFGVALKASEHLVFEQALQGDFNADSAPDVVAWLTDDPTAKADTPTASVGELWLYPSGAAPVRLLSQPGFLPATPSCKQSATLSRTGPQTVTLQNKSSCDPPPLGHLPTQAISVVAPGRETPLVLTLRVATLPQVQAADAANEITFDVSTLDRDNDGRDDVELTARIGDKPAVGAGAGNDTGEAEVRFVWLDRKAGLSRDTTFPAKDFNDIGSIEVVRAPGKTTRQKTLTRINAVRSLIAAVCAESKSPLLEDSDNNPLPCNLTPQIISFFATAELRAQLAGRNYGDALNALLRADWYGGALQPDAKTTLETDFEKTVPLKPIHSIAVAEAIPTGASSIPRFSPLSFSPEGLLIQNSDGITRMDLQTFQESDVSDEVDRWPLTVISPSGQRLVGVAYPCDRPTLALLISEDSGAAAAPINTTLLAPRPGMCSGARAVFDELPLRPVSWNALGLRVFLGGNELGADAATNTALAIGQPKSTPPGSARSENGSRAVIATSLGLLVLNPSGAELWRDGDIPSKRLSECVIDDGAKYVACLDKGKARVFAAGEKPPAEKTKAPPGGDLHQR